MVVRHRTEKLREEIRTLKKMKNKNNEREVEKTISFLEKIIQEETTPKKREWLVKIRKDKNISQWEMAEILETSQRNVSFIERGERSLQPSQAMMLREKLGIPWEVISKEEGWELN